MSINDNEPTIPEFYRGSKIFVTGGSGFMGKVLIEKLLRSCPDVGTIYLLMRPKKGRDSRSRVKDLTDQPFFDRLKQENVSSLAKLVPICGDVKELGLGLSDEDRQMLQREVSVIFHLAASVRFDDPIGDAIITNVRGTLEVVNLALGMKNLQVFLHLSTTYCNCDLSEVFEEIYPPPGDWRAMIAMVEKNDDAHLLRCVTPKILGKLPNTYTYAKALSEQVINDHQHMLPLVIVRPSIVLWTLDDPLPGWVDNFNGPIGLLIAGGYGLVTVSYANPECINDYVPVDVAIKSIIFIAQQRALKTRNVETASVPVYNCSSMTEHFAFSDFIKSAFRSHSKYPFDNVLWYTTSKLTTSWINFYLQMVFFHLFPAILLDKLIKLANKKPMLTKIIRRAYIANNALIAFNFRNFYFNNKKFVQLESDSMSSSDLKDFSYCKGVTDFSQYMDNGLKTTRVHLLKDSPKSLPHARRHFNRMYWVDRSCKLAFALTIFWAVGGCAAVTGAVALVPHYIYHI